MDTQFARTRYLTSVFHNDADGCAGVDLWEVREDARIHVAKLIYWDAVGQYFLEPTKEEIPLQILNAMIRESTELVKVPTPPWT